MKIPRSVQKLIDNYPSEVKQVLFTIRERVEQIKKQYGSMRRYGKTPIETKTELAIIYYLIKNELSTRQLGKILGVQYVTVFRWKQAIEEKGEFYIAGEKQEVDPNELLELAKEIFNPKAKKWVKSILDSAVIQEFVKNPVKRQKSSKHGQYYTRREVNNTLRQVAELSKFIKQNKDQLERILKQPVTNNPDYWTEDFARSVIDIYCSQKHSESFKIMVCKRNMKLYMRRIPKWKDWFSGEIGSVKGVIRPKEATMYLEHYYKLKKIAQESDDPELKALYLIVALHLWTGAREGYGSLRNKLERLEATGIKVKNNKLSKIDLDDPIVDTSLIGIKWKNAKFDSQGNLIGFDVYEEKTKKTWTLSIQWLDDDISRLLLEVYEQTARKRRIDSVVKSILVHYEVDPPKSKIWSVETFMRWYQKKVREISELLRLPWKLTPHRIRSGHIAILAELRIPLEMALSNTGFGVGWDDMSTAIIFYLRFSQRLLKDYIKQAEQIKQQILKEIT